MFKCDKVRFVEFSDNLMKNTKVSKVMLSLALGLTVLVGGVAISAEVLAPSEKDSNKLDERLTQIELPSSDLVIVDKQKQLEEIKLEGIKIQKEREEAERLRLAKIEAERKAKVEAQRKAREELKRKRLAEIERQKAIVIAEEKARKTRLAEQKKKKQQAQKTQTSKPQGSGKAFNASYYTPYCTGCSGVTATGINVRSSIYYQGMRVVAVDPRVIPLYSIVQVTTPHESFKAIALDTGGAIKGHKIDILVADKATAYSLGRHTVTVQVLRKGK